VAIILISVIPILIEWLKHRSEKAREKKMTAETTSGK
jgi:hypothetical protein